MERLSPDVRQLLLKTSVLSDINIRSAEALTGLSNAGDLLHSCTAPATLPSVGGGLSHRIDTIRCFETFFSTGHEWTWARPKSNAPAKRGGPPHQRGVASKRLCLCSRLLEGLGRPCTGDSRPSPGTGGDRTYSNAGSLDFMYSRAGSRTKSLAHVLAGEHESVASTPIKPTPCSIKAWTNSCGRAIERARYCPGAVRSGQSSYDGTVLGGSQNSWSCFNHPSRRCFLPLDRGRGPCRRLSGWCDHADPSGQG